MMAILRIHGADSSHQQQKETKPGHNGVFMRKYTGNKLQNHFWFSGL
jgi:hypothetical protein